MVLLHPKAMTNKFSHHYRRNLETVLSSPIRNISKKLRSLKDIGSNKLLDYQILDFLNI